MLGHRSTLSALDLRGAESQCWKSAGPVVGRLRTSAAAWVLKKPSGGGRRGASFYRRRSIRPPKGRGGTARDAASLAAGRAARNREHRVGRCRSQRPTPSRKARTNLKAQAKPQTGIETLIPRWSPAKRTPGWVGREKRHETQPSAILLCCAPGRFIRFVGERDVASGHRGQEKAA